MQLQFNPSSVNLNVGERAFVAVEVSNLPASGLAAFQLDIGFDPTFIDLLNPNEPFRGSVDPFAPLGSNGLCTTVRGTPSCTDPDWLLISTGRSTLGSDSINNGSGALQIAYGSFGLSPLPSGDGAIAFIELFGAYDGTVTVQLTDAILADDSEPPTSYATTAGTLQVVVGTGIGNVAPTLSLIGDQSTFERVPLEIPIGSNDSDGDNLSLSASGLPSFCLLTDNGDGSGALSCSPQIGDAGGYLVTISSTDDGAPNLSDDETILIDVVISNCTDGDLDGFGSPGDLSCPEGTTTDCDDSLAAINPAASELCRNAADDNCNGLTDAQEAECPASACMIVTLGAPGSDPTIQFSDVASCPTPAALPRTIDFIWGDLTAIRLDAGDIKVGVVSQLACASSDDTQLFDNLRPDAGANDFFLVRESGQPSYGSSSAAEPRSADSGDCP